MKEIVSFSVYTMLVVILLTMFISVSGTENGDPTTNSAKPNSQTAQPSTVHVPITSTIAPKNVTSNETQLEKGPFSTILENKGMLWRTFYVLLGLTSIVVIYFGVRAWRSRRRQSKSRKYGLITTRGADLEMEPLDQDMDDDDDMTVFELNGRRK